MDLPKADINLVVQDLTQRAQAMAAGSTMQAQDDNHPATDQVIRRMLQSGSELMASCAALAHGPHALAINILIRPLLEMVIKVHWATLCVENAQLLQDSTSEQFKTIAKINIKRGILKIVDDSGNDHTAAFVAQGHVEKGPKAPSIEVMATQCGISDIYNVFYRFQSLHSHVGDVATRSENTAPVLEVVGAFSVLLGHLGVRWLVHRSRPNNEEIRCLLGFERFASP